MKKLILLFTLVLFLSGCASFIRFVPEERLDRWALENEYILAENCPELVVPERQPLPHPDVPTIHVKDADGNLIPITQQYLMRVVITLFGTVEKYQYLAEIYEREYLNADGKILPDLTLEELKQLYLQRIQAIDLVEPAEPEVDPETGFPSTGSGTPDITVDEFATIVEAFNYFQEQAVEEE